MPSDPGIAEIRAKILAEILVTESHLEELRKRLAAADELIGYLEAGIDEDVRSETNLDSTNLSGHYKEIGPSRAILTLLAANPTRRYSRGRILEGLEAAGWKSISTNRGELIGVTLRYLEKNQRVLAYRDEHGRTYQHKPDQEKKGGNEP